MSVNIYILNLSMVIDIVFLLEQMQQLGIKTKLIDVFDAPPVVKEIMRTQAQLDYSVSIVLCRKSAIILGHF